jgi:peroxin-13
MMFFGRLSFLVDENAHAVHFFITALLQLLDRAGSLYGEIARFILRVIFRRKRKPGLPMPPGAGKQQQLGLPPPGAPGSSGGGMLALPAPAHHAAAAAGGRGGWSPPPMPTGELPSGAGPWENLWDS